MMNGRVGGLGLLFVSIYSCSDNISCSPRWPQIHSVAGPGLTDTPEPPAPYTPQCQDYRPLSPHMTENVHFGVRTQFLFCTL